MKTEPTEQASRRGCVIFGGAISLIVLALIAISLGWIGPIDRGKETDLPVIGGNQS